MIFVCKILLIDCSLYTQSIEFMLMVMCMEDLLFGDHVRMYVGKLSIEMVGLTSALVQKYELRGMLVKT